MGEDSVRHQQLEFDLRRPQIDTTQKQASYSDIPNAKIEAPYYGSLERVRGGELV